MIVTQNQVICCAKKYLRFLRTSLYICNREESFDRCFISSIIWLKHEQQGEKSSLAKAPAQVAPLQVHCYDIVSSNAQSITNSERHPSTDPQRLKAPCALIQSNRASTTFLVQRMPLLSIMIKLLHFKNKKRNCNH
jgi:hypothetical protein